MRDLTRICWQSSRHREVEVVWRSVLLSIALCFVGCGGEGDSAPNKSPGQPIATEVFRTGAFCITLSEPNTVHAVGRDSLPVGVEAWLATPSGQKVKRLYAYRDTMNSATSMQFNLVDDYYFPAGFNESIRKELTADVNNRLLVDCEYRNTSTGRSMSLTGMWEISQLRGKAAIVSPFSDLVAKAISTALSRGGDPKTVENLAIAQLETRFGAIGVHPLPIADFESYGYKEGLFVGDGAPIRSSMRSLFAHASILNMDDYAGYAAAAGASLAGICSNFEVCLMYKPSGTVTVNLNPDFSNGTNGWTAIRNVSASRVYSLDAGIDGTVLVKLTDRGITEQRLDEIGMQQTIPMSGSQLEKFGVHFQLEELSAGTTAWIANAFESGVAGGYICFDGPSGTLGCYLVGYHFDALQIGNHASNLFKVESSASIYYDLATQDRTVRFISLGRAAVLIPNVRANLWQVQTVRIGIAATESVNQGRNRCLGCYATVRATRVALERGV